MDKDVEIQKIEYVQNLEYIRHMSDTRSQIFQFCVTLNSGLLAVVFQFLTENATKIIISALAGVITLAITLMAARSLKYLKALESVVIEIETNLGASLIRDTNAKTPKGIDSSTYLILTYWLLCLMWIAILIFLSLK